MTRSTAASRPDESSTEVRFGLGGVSALLVRGDCFEWLKARHKRSIQAVVTDPPFGVVEFSDRELAKKSSGHGGIWRIPPSIGGSIRKPMPRFTVLSPVEMTSLQEFFFEWATLLRPTLVPGAHVFVASTTALHHTAFSAIQASGLESRGEIVRVVRTLRGGDRPKGAEDIYPEVSSMLRSNWEPWGVFREPFAGTLRDNLATWGTGGLRRRSDGSPLPDVLASGRTSQSERLLADHPSLKPQEFLREIVRAALPLGVGTVLDPFAGSGSTLAAAAAVGYSSIGVERNEVFFAEASRAIPRLAALYPARTLTA